MGFLINLLDTSSEQGGLRPSTYRDLASAVGWGVQRLPILSFCTADDALDSDK